PTGQGRQRALETYTRRGRLLGGVLLPGAHGGEGAGDRHAEEICAQAAQGAAGPRALHAREDADRSPRRAGATRARRSRRGRRMSWYPEGRAVPEERRTARLALRPLLATDVAADYDAVMSSAPMLRAWSQSTWPADDFTLAENLEDLR